jgi:hypothetical protein
MFGDFLYDETIEETEDKKKEFEMISIREFSQIVKSHMSLQDKHVQAISIMLSDHFIGDAFNFKFFEEIFKQMGIIQNEIALDNKSIRILNRLREYLKANFKDELGLRKLLPYQIFT